MNLTTARASHRWKEIGVPTVRLDNGRHRGVIEKQDGQRGLQERQLGLAAGKENTAARLPEA